DHFSLDDHLAALEEHVGRDLFAYVLANDKVDVQFPPHMSVEAVAPEMQLGGTYQFITRDLVDRENPWQHDPRKLAGALMNLFWTARANTTADQSVGL
ncbi:MAG TPA: hypothetical protein VM075_10570, partial [Anaerolineae bacterium]|nr:hypothetical protein [Anaerolineae bacterium]